MSSYEEYQKQLYKPNFEQKQGTAIVKDDEGKLKKVKSIELEEPTDEIRKAHAKHEKTSEELLDLIQSKFPATGFAAQNFHDPNGKTGFSVITPLNPQTLLAPVDYDYLEEIVDKFDTADFDYRVNRLDKAMKVDVAEPKEVTPEEPEGKPEESKEKE